MKRSYKTILGKIGAEALAFTTGKDPDLDRRLIVADCLGTAAHATMLAELPLKPKLLMPVEKKRVLAGLAGIIRRARKNSFKISLQDQDVHMAIERALTGKLGETGKKIHAGRSRNDQAAVDLRLYGKEQMLALAPAAFRLCEALLRLAKKHQFTPMAGRTHMQPAMPSSVGLWAAAFAEGLLDDAEILKQAYLLNDRSPLGSAAGYGAALPLDRRRTSALLGFRRPIHNVLHAGNTRGKMESIILAALAQTMVTLSRLAQDLIIFSMPEFNYFILPAEMCTGSSIMPQKRNPDVLELIRARAARVCAHAAGTLEIVRGLPSGYNRDLQETKEPFLEGLAITRESLRIMIPLVENLKVNRAALLAGFNPEIFAADRALELTGQGMPFRAAYLHVKEHLNELGNPNPIDAIRRKRHLGATGALGLESLQARLEKERRYFAGEQGFFHRAISRLLGMKYP